MTREQIEKAANIDMLSYYSDEEYPCGIKDIQSGFIDAFSRGAKWRINSVWHDASEIPQHSGILIAICKDGKAVLCGPNNSDWKTTVKIFHIVKWAYIDDLRPERKEETK